MKDKLNLATNSRAKRNNFLINIYLIMKQLVISSIKWENMPEEIDKRYVELTLLEKNRVLFFKDEDYKCLQFTGNGFIDIYNNPTGFMVNTPSGYFNDTLTYRDAVPIYSNLTRTWEIPIIQEFAREMTDIYMCMETNIDLVNTPGLLTAPKDMQLTLENAVGQKKEGVPVILAKESFENIEYKVFGVEGQKYFICDKLILLYQAKWNEFLTYFGISNIQQQKRERLITDEVMRAQGGCIASRNNRMVPRLYAAEEINRMFGLNIKPVFRDVFEGGEDDEQLYDTAEIPLREPGGGDGEPAAPPRQRGD